MAPSFLHSSSASSGSVAIVSKCRVYPETASMLGDHPLSVSDLPMLSCHYIQKGLFFSPPPIPVPCLLSLLKSALSRALSLFPPLAGRLFTLPDGRIVVACNDYGVDFFHAEAPSLMLSALLPPSSDVPPPVNSFFPLDGTISFDGHVCPLAAFQLTQLGDGAVFLGCAVNHAVVDGTSFWNFFNSWAELCRTSSNPKPPDFHRNFFGGSTAVLRFPNGGRPEVTFDASAPLRERIFHFSSDAIRDLKFKANCRQKQLMVDIVDQNAEVYGKLAHDPKAATEGDAISSFQSLCALLWLSVTRARKKLPAEAVTTSRMAVNCRHRVQPPVSSDYFGNAIQSIPTQATADEVRGNGVGWVARRLHASVVAYRDAAVRKAVAEWEAEPRCFPLGNPDGGVLTMGSSPRFPMYDGNDLGWGRPVAVRSGRANKFDGKMSAFPGREGAGSVDVEVCLAPETMAALLHDDDFMRYVSRDYDPMASLPQL